MSRTSRSETSMVGTIPVTSSTAITNPYASSHSPKRRQPGPDQPGTSWLVVPITDIISCHIAVLLYSCRRLRPVPKQAHHLRRSLYVYFQAPPIPGTNSPPRTNRTDFNVTGTSSGVEGGVVVDLECSATCDDITATGTHLTTGGNSTTAEYVCKNIATQDQVRFRPAPRL